MLEISKDLKEAMIQMLQQAIMNTLETSKI